MNIILDIGNVIMYINYKEIIKKFAKNKDDEDFIIKNIINSPEWLGNGLIDTGFINLEQAICLIQDRTNHKNDQLVRDFLENNIKYAYVNEEVIEIIKNLRQKNHKIYLLSNINPYMDQFIQDNSNLYDHIDGAVFSYKYHQIKPYEQIYKTLINKYNLEINKSIFIDDNQNNVNVANSLGICSYKINKDDINDFKNIINKYVN